MAAKTVNIFTVLPIEQATQLSQEHKLQGHNTVPQIDTAIIEAVREYMIDNVGYENLPMACLSANSRVFQADSTEIFHILPANNKSSVLFVIQMPEDMIISVRYQDLLDASREAEDCDGDEDSLEFVKENLKDLLVLGQGDYLPDEEIIEFIPYLDYNKCKGYAKFNEEFGTTVQSGFPGIKEYSVAKLTAFIE